MAPSPLFADPGFFLRPPEARAGALLVHGFSGNPEDMAHLGRRLAHAGQAAAGLMLAGHVGDESYWAQRRMGAGWHRLWREEVRLGLAELADSVPSPFLVGFSMGALLCAIEAAERPHRLRGLVLLATPFRVASQRSRPVVAVLSRLAADRSIVIKSEVDISRRQSERRYPIRLRMTVGAIESFFRLQPAARRGLGRVNLPVLAVHSRLDHTAPYANLAEVGRVLSGRRLETLTLERSFHVIPDDVERDVLADAVIDFIARHA